MIETKSRSCEGWFPSRNVSVLEPPPRDALRDPAALLTQEGNWLILDLVPALASIYRCA
jgi:hypothetical protein